MPFNIKQDHIIMLFLIIIIFASGNDLLVDYDDGETTTHIVVEAAIMLIGIAFFIWISLSLKKSKLTVDKLNTEIDSIKNKKQSTEVIATKRQLSKTIATQFEEWGLSKSEMEVGLLLLKGFSLKEISELRGTAEKTIRQQASAIYKKADLGGRHAFSAWFIEDFL